MSIEPYETVTTTKIQRLFRYQRFVPARLDTLLTQRTIYFSSPDEFNDPWDCKPWFTTPSDSGGRENIIQWFNRVSRKHHPDVDETLRAREIDRLRNDPNYLGSKIEEASRAIMAELGRRYRVCCLTARPDCPLMWAHYADKHRGVCLEFDVWQRDLCSAIKVEYRDTYPVFPLDEGTDISPFYTKSADWQYEQEYRLIAEEESMAYSAVTMKTKDGIYTLPPDTLKSIIIGAQASRSVHEQIGEMVSRSRSSVAVRVARCLPDRYQLVIEPPLTTY
jgi:hypothetical protein